MSQKHKKKNKQTKICCRNSFLSDQIITQEQNHMIQYKYFKLPIQTNSINQFNLKKTICGMLNCLGGFIFIGIKEEFQDSNITRIVRGYPLNQRRKQELKKYFNRLSNQFYPKIDTSMKDLIIKFLPVQGKNDTKYLIKIIVKNINRKYFYSFKHSVQDQQIKLTNLFYKRYDNQTKQLTDMAEIYAQILKKQFNNQKQISHNCKQESQYQSQDDNIHTIYLSQQDEQNSTLNVLQDISFQQKKILNRSLLNSTGSTSNQKSFEQMSNISKIQVGQIQKKQEEIIEGYSYTTVKNVLYSKSNQFEKIIKKYQRQPGKLESERIEDYKNYTIKFINYKEHLKFQQQILKNCKQFFQNNKILLNLIE